MKKNIVIAILLMPILFSCGKKKSIVENIPKDTAQVTVKIDSLAFEVDTFHVIEKEKDCTDCSSCDLYYERIKTSLKPVHDSVNQYIDTIMMSGLSWMGGDEFKYDLKKRADAFFAFKKEMEAENGEGTGAWDWELNLTIFRACNEIITVSSGWGGYTGGAHPNYESYSASFFTSNGKRVTMQNLFTDIKPVNRMAVKHFKKDNQLDPNTDCSEQGWDVTDEEFELNENFDITTESITWQFNAYEIGPYVAGAPSVSIPMKDLEKYLKVKFTDVVIQ
jgi:NAD-dependent dihydropyrimidine dehydrogenase PreA subunit